MRKKTRRFSLCARGRSVLWALRGLCDMLRTEHNAWIHALATVTVFAVSYWLVLGATEWALIVLAVTGVWVAETFNTVFEILTDKVAPEYSEEARRLKDIAAAGVLITVLGAATVGALVLAPPLGDRLWGASS